MTRGVSTSWCEEGVKGRTDSCFPLVHVSIVDGGGGASFGEGVLAKVVELLCDALGRHGRDLFGRHGRNEVWVGLERIERGVERGERGEVAREEGKSGTERTSVCGQRSEGGSGVV